MFVLNLSMNPFKILLLGQTLSDDTRIIKALDVMCVSEHMRRLERSPQSFNPKI